MWAMWTRSVDMRARICTHMCMGPLSARVSTGEWENGNRSPTTPRTPTQGQGLWTPKIPPHPMGIWETLEKNHLKKNTLGEHLGGSVGHS